ncbi:GyrI-like domain-containing protein [Streptococcus agalactiae]|uniref:GyrI-like domain-containing protein n=1 Tax=Streptococcus agalactiae TaxID=1311 RepID=UPI0022AECE9C|nr:GyrI-like domain-containing protein [Streptococcus agalactiae]
MKYEWRKQEKNLYGVKQTPIIVEVPKQKFILIKGKGNPNETDFSDRISALYSVAYAIKMLFKNAMKNKTDSEITDFTVYPLEGLWKKVDGKELDKSKLEYTLMIKQPDFITQEIFTEALENVKKKKPNALYDEMSFREIEEGKSIQTLHVGSYDDEPKSFEQMNEFVRKLNLTRIGDFHREIYLSNKNRTSEEKQKTILRYSVK